MQCVLDDDRNDEGAAEEGYSCIVIFGVALNADLRWRDM